MKQFHQSDQSDEHAQSVATEATTSILQQYPRIRWLTLALAAVVLLILAGSGGYLLHGNTHAVNSDRQVPSYAPVPGESTLLRTENFLSNGKQNWYFAVPQMTENEVIAFYKTQLPHQGWRCFTAMTSTNMTYYNQPLSGTSVYMTAIRGTTKAQIYVGDQDYGAFLLGDDVPAGAIALKISLEPAKNAPCP